MSQNAPLPHGRSLISCKKLLIRLKEKHKNDIEKIKNNRPLVAAADGEATATPEKPKTPRKRKRKVAEGSADGNDDAAAEGSPKKKATPRKRKGAATKESVKKEIVEDDDDV